MTNEEWEVRSEEWGMKNEENVGRSDYSKYRFIEISKSQKSKVKSQKSKVESRKPGAGIYEKIQKKCTLSDRFFALHPSIYMRDDNNWWIDKW